MFRRVEMVNVPIYRQFFQCLENAADGVWAEFASPSLTSMRSMIPFANGINLPHVVIRWNYPKERRHETLHELANPDIRLAPSRSITSIGSI
jgi:hypothetical protein